jgi:phosphoenolpyruvate---glycerone phosphotransferase subunit DhaK
MMDRLLADMPLKKGDRVSILVNSLGATPPEELYILYRVVKARLDGAGADHRHAAGRPLCDLDGDGGRVLHALQARRRARGLLKAPCDCAFWRVG